jgi:hypothetical protein
MNKEQNVSNPEIYYVVHKNSSWDSILIMYTHCFFKELLAFFKIILRCTVMKMHDRIGFICFLSFCLLDVLIISV